VEVSNHFRSAARSELVHSAGEIFSSWTDHSLSSAKRTPRTEQAPGGAAIRHEITASGENVPTFAKSVSPILIMTSFATFADVFTKETSNPTFWSPFSEAETPTSVAFKRACFAITLESHPCNTMGGNTAASVLPSSKHAIEIVAAQREASRNVTVSRSVVKALTVFLRRLRILPLKGA
jgi:hypothetical protein